MTSVPASTLYSQLSHKNQNSALSPLRTTIFGQRKAQNLPGTSKKRISQPVEKIEFREIGSMLSNLAETEQ